MTEHDPIETILKATGRRPPVAAERAERVRSVARSQWQRELTRRTRRRRAMWIGSLAAVAVVIVAGFALREPAIPVAPSSAILVERVANGVRMRTGSIPPFRTVEILRADASVPAGVSLITSPDGRAALRVAGGRSIRLDGDTTLRVLSDRTFALVAGAVYVDSGTGVADEWRASASNAVRTGRRHGNPVRSAGPRRHAEPSHPGGIRDAWRDHRRPHGVGGGAPPARAGRPDRPKHRGGDVAGLGVG